MGVTSRAAVALVPLGFCHVNLPPAWASSLLDQKGFQPSKVAIKLSWTAGTAASGEKPRPRTAFFSWAGGVSTSTGVTAPEWNPSAWASATTAASSDIVEIDSSLADQLGIANGVEVAVDIIQNTQVAKEVHVEPVSEDDWEIIELHASFLEENILAQVGVVYSEEVLVIRVHRATIVKLRVCELNPSAEYLRLGTDTEVIIAPKQRKPAAGTAANPLDATPATPAEPANSARAFPIGRDFDTAPHASGLVPNVAFLGVRKSDKKRAGGKKAAGEGGSAAGSVRKLSVWDAPNPLSDKTGEEADGGATERSVYVMVFESVRVPPGQIGIHPDFWDQLQLPAYCRVVLSEPERPLAGGFKFSVTLLEKRSNEPLSVKSLKEKPAAVQLFQNVMESKAKEELAVLYSGLLLSVPDGAQSRSLKVDILSASPPFAVQSGFVTISKLKDLTVEEGSSTDGESKISKEDEKLPQLGGVDKTYTEIRKWTRSQTTKIAVRKAVFPKSLCGLLLFGNRGSGKTVILKTLLRECQLAPFSLYSQYVDCREIMNVKEPKVVSALEQIFVKAVWSAPSVIVLDNLHVLVPSDPENEGGKSLNLAHALVKLVHLYCSSRQDIAVVGSAIDKDSLHKVVVTSHAFDEFVHIAPPNKPEREAMLRAMISDRSAAGDLDLSDVVAATEGYLAADLKVLVERSLSNSVLRAVNENQVAADTKITLETGDILKAVKEFVPTALKGLKLVDAGASWSDIGGLREAKKILIETLEWPTKYAKVFASSSLRQRSGILLYGYPGCGKTLLASAVAKECGLNFISVKGPELLNKYIGASEKSVRDLFERAQAAKPCILFFDEFESIAPRRGNDNTGVTDRVVNQMLTQMDGAEGIDGVYVLAATSRPDLIDPALVRPGRLDKAVKCDMPDFEDRLNILQTLSKKVSIDEDVNLASVAGACAGFSGADIQGLLYTANLAAMHEAMEGEGGESHVGKAAAGAGPNGNGDDNNDDDQMEVLQPKSELAMPRSKRAELLARVSRMKRDLERDGSRTEGEAQDGAKREAVTHTVKARHFKAALEQTRASLSEAEVRKFAGYFAEFTGEPTLSAKAYGKKTMMG
ncbi:P-loop containing nucleoside triphosphate hydrolase protein [Zopfochytrium polystomum]|nr:P-loop containing nucleoside triphosphate hydrolase protein [Zopfochytrium polystomum]